KKNKRILESNPYTYSADSLHNNDTLSIAVKRDDTLMFAYYFTDIDLAKGIQSADAMLISSSKKTHTEPASVFSTIEPKDEIFGRLYRGWGQFDYKTDSLTSLLPIDENMLVPPNMEDPDVGSIQDTSDLAGIETEGDIFNFMVPYSENDLYMGVDEYVYVTDRYISSSRQGEKNVVVEPIVIPESGLTSVHRENLEITKSASAGAGANIGPVGVSASYSHSSLESNMLIDMIDMNGDRFPDLLTTENIQYTGVTGVLKGSPVNHTMGDHHATGKANGFVAGGSFASAKSNNSATPESSSSSTKTDGVNAKEKATKRNNKSGQSQETAGASLGISGNSVFNEDVVDQTWLDINGDGLPDKISVGGSVRLNLGYSFAPAESWNFDTVSAGKSRDIGGGLGVNIGNGSIEAGVGISHTKNEAIYALIDLNADGLPDIVRNNSSLELGQDGWPPVDRVRNITVQFNTGSGFDVPIDWSDLGPLNQGVSVGESATTGFTIGIPLVPPTPVVKWCINPSGSVNRGISKTITEVADIDGDGFPD
ncbi:MAG: hypothetical protein ACK2TU_04050, partial [Anaerolineales bacterium]